MLTFQFFSSPYYGTHKSRNEDAMHPSSKNVRWAPDLLLQNCVFEPLPIERLLPSLPAVMQFMSPETNCHL